MKPRLKWTLIGVGVVIVLLFVMGLIFNPRSFKRPEGFKPPASFGPAGGSQSSEQKTMILPFNEQDAINTYQGLWPYGIKGGDHPEGHIGIDFELKEGAPLLAAADGTVSAAGDAPGHEEERVTLNHGGFDTWYVGQLKDIAIKDGDKVKAGQTIALVDKMNLKGKLVDAGSIHFEVFRKFQFPPGAACPMDYFNEQAKAVVERLHAESKYQERIQYPEICNPL